jgi:acylpyruvate hydrolase
MQIGTLRHDGHTQAVRVEEDELVLLAAPDVGTLLGTDGLAAAESAQGERVPAAGASWAPLVPLPNKIICVGLNYHEHVNEMGHDVPTAPTYFSKFSGALIGANDDIALPPASVSEAVDWEVELCVVIGAAGRNIAAENALQHIAGYTILNDVSVRDWQRRSKQFLAGKTFEGTTPVGPIMTTTDVLGDGSGLAVSTSVDGVVKQQSSTDELVFTVPTLIADLSTIITLLPGDLIATGTPSGVGAARTPPEFLSNGQEMVTTIEGIGELRNRCVRVG